MKRAATYRALAWGFAVLLAADLVTIGYYQIPELLGYPGSEHGLPWFVLSLWGGVPIALALVLAFGWSVVRCEEERHVQTQRGFEVVTPVNQAAPLPDRVGVQVTPPMEGVLVHLVFEMVAKNNYSFLLVTDSNGHAVAQRDELLKSFDEDAAFAIMDFHNARGAFSGRVTAKVLAISEIEAALRAYEKFGKYMPCPASLETNLRNALARGQDPGAYQVQVTMG